MPAGAERSLTLKLTEDRKGNALLSAARDLDKLAAGIDHTGGSMQDMASDAEKLNVQIAESEKRVKELQTQIARTGDRGLFGDLRKEKSQLSELQNVFKALMPDPGRAGTAAGGAFLSGLTDSMKDLPLPLKGILYGALAEAAVLAAPTVAGVIGGAISGAVGTAGIAAGLFAASHDSRVQAAAKDFGATLSDEFFASGAAFVDPAIKSLELLQTTVKNLNIDDMLAGAAPSVEIMANGVADLVKNLGPGLEKTLARSAPFADAAAEGFGNMGTALGDFLDEVSGSEGALLGMDALFKIVNGSIVAVGKTLGVLEDEYSGFIKLNAALFGGLEDMYSFVNPNAAMGAAHFNDMYEAMITNADTMTRFGSVAEGAMDPFNDYLRQAVENTDALTLKLQDLFDHTLGLSNAQIAYEQSVDDLAESFKENGRQLDINTEKGRNNQRALNEAIADAIAVRDKLAETEGIDAANTAYNNMILRIYEIGRAAGLTKEDLDRLVKNQYTVSVVYKVSGSAGPGSHAQYLMSGSTAALLGGQRAAGGPVIAGVPYQINERAKETVTFGADAMVHPANLTPMMGGSPTLNVQVGGTPTGALERMFVEWMLGALRVEVQGRGGAERAFA